MSLLSQLNPMQREAVITTEGPLLLLAGAGSGKTRVLTYRIAHLVEQGVNPFNIIAITFTNKAAREMKERIESLVAENSGIWVSTFHSTCVRILRREISYLGYDNSFTIYDSDDSEKLVKTLLKELNVNDKQFPAKSVMGEIGKAKDSLIGPSSYEKENGSDFRLGVISRIYKAYQAKLKASNALDFDDIIFKTVELFISRPDVLEKYQTRFKYVLVDEYQDTNTAQYTLIRLLSEKYKNLCVVGDDDQSIYGWRGANIRNILDFEKDFPNAKTIKLEQNYRSTKNILNSANAVIQNNFSRKDKVLWTEHIDGSLIETFRADTDLDEAQFLSNVIMTKKSEGKSYSDFAVLYRTNAQSRVIEDSFVRNNIKYRIFGGLRFYDRREIKDVLAYLKCIYNPLDEIATKRIINVPKRGIGDTTVDKLSEYANEREISFFDALKDVDIALGTSTRNKKILEFVELLEELRKQSFELPVSELINIVLEKTGYILDLLSSKNDASESQDRVENINQLIAKALEFEKQTENPYLAEFLEDVALVADIDNYTEGEESVVLMTLHSSKGLEFPTVFLVGFEEGIFPSYRSIMSGEIKELEEERRLCYVGITRARENLYITYAIQRMQHGRIVYNAPSSFLKEIPVEYLQSNNKKKVVKDKNMEKSNSDNKITSNSRSSVKSALSETYKPIGFGENSYSSKPDMPMPKNIELDFAVGDMVKQMKYGVGKVCDIVPAGADFEVTVEFNNIGKKKFMAHLSKLVKV